MSKTILITGSTDGIGKLAATRLAKDGHEIYVHGRNQEKLNNVISEIKTASNNSKVKGFVADLSDLGDVENFAAEVIDEISDLDVLINNAGVFKSSAAKTDNGFDIRFVVNYLAPYLLTHELLPLLKKPTASRIINLSSAAQESVSLDALLGNQDLTEQGSYAQSKLALTMWSFYLAEKEPSLSVVAVNPGSLLNTNMVREAYGKFWSPAEKGSDILYDLAVSTEHNDSSGKYFDNDRGAFGKAHHDAYDGSLVTSLIEATDKILDLK